MSDRDLSESLRELVETLDLGEYDIEAYLAVLENGDVTASELAERTDIPQPRVYDTVRGLADRGLVELRESRPMRVVAVDPEEAFGDLQSDLTELVDALERAYVAPARDTEAVTLVKSRATILRYVEDVIESAEYELSVSLTPELLSRVEGRLADAIDRDVSVELVVAPAADAPDPAAYDYERVATTARGRRGITTPIIVVADGEYSVYASRSAVRDGTEEYGVIFNRSALGFLALAFFGTVVWTTADTPLVDDGDGRTFPRRYASIRRCIKDLSELPGVAYARVEGRDVLTGEHRVVTGEIASARVTDDEEIATLTVDAGGETVEIGGRVAAYEDIEAHQILIGTEPIRE
jgi:sugar-specific transcriptional regulator TrmB